MSMSVKDVYHTAAYLRIVALSIAGYDYAQTLPRAIRFYREQHSSGRITISLILFMLIRFMSISVLILSSVSFFYPHTPQTCRHFFLLPPIFKVLQAMISQAILGLRAYNLSRRSHLIGRGGLVVYSITCVLQWVTSLYRRTPTVNANTGTCTAYNPVGAVGAYVFYIIAMAYDLTATAVCVYYLLKFKLNSPTKTMVSKLTTMMLRDGVGYFILLAAVNTLNMILYRNQQIQTAGSSLAYAVTWIMSQRLLLHVHDASLERRNDSVAAIVTVTQNINTGRDLTQAIRSQFERRKNTTAFDLTVPDFDMSMHHGGVEIPENSGVQVRIERTVKLEPVARFELEDYRRRPSQQYSWQKR